MTLRTIFMLRSESSGMAALARLSRLGCRLRCRCLLAFRKWRAVRRSRRALSALNDRLLSDLGVTRHQIGLVERNDRYLDETLRYRYGPPPMFAALDPAASCRRQRF
jgi:uncharacterized protein YjiS (DUF1127 family)